MNETDEYSARDRARDEAITRLNNNVFELMKYTSELLKRSNEQERKINILKECLIEANERSERADNKINKNMKKIANALFLRKVIVNLD